MTKYFLKLVMLVLLFNGTALAHDPGLSAAEVRILPDRIVAEVSFARVDFDPKLGERLLEIKGLGLRHFDVQTPDATSIHFTLEFPISSATELHLIATAFDHLPRGHKQFLSVRDSEGKILTERMLSAESKDLTITLHSNSGSSGERFFRFLVLGIEHILTGYDHLAFLLALLIAGGSLRHNTKIITSFTVAHSLTLALATLGLVNISPAIVEPLIAFSIVFVGLENLFRRRVAARWLVTFGFGLVHGLGFAATLRELGIGTLGARVAVPLLSFNVGVELAQIAIAVLVLPLVWRLERRPSFTLKHVPAFSLLITFAGIYWFLARTLM